MGQSKFIETKAIKTNENELVPLWDPRVKFVKSDHFGDHFRMEDDHRMAQVVECLFDVKEKQLVLGVEVDIYPDVTTGPYVKGAKVLYEIRGHHTLRSSTIVDIVFEEFEMTIKKGKKLEDYEIDMLKEKGIDFDPTTIYAIKRWKACYAMADGTKIRYNHQMYTLEE